MTKTSGAASLSFLTHRNSALERVAWFPRQGHSVAEEGGVRTRQCAPPQRNDPSGRPHGETEIQLTSATTYRLLWSILHSSSVRMPGPRFNSSPSCLLPEKRSSELPGMSKADELAVFPPESHRGGEASDYEASRRKTYPGRM